LRAHHDLSPVWSWTGRAGIAAAIVLNIWVTLHGVIAGAMLNPPFQPPVGGYVESGFIPRDTPDPRNLPDTPAVMFEPKTAQVEISRWEPEYRELQLRLSEPGRVRLKTYNFHGWVARIDGQKTPITSDQDGAQQIEVPEGIHRLQVSFDTTSARAAGTMFSGLGLLIAIALTLMGRLQRGTADAASSASKMALKDEHPERDGVTTIARTNQRFKYYLPILGILVVGAAIMFVMMKRPGSQISRSDNPGSQSGNSVGAQPPGATPVVEPQAKVYLAGKDAVPVALDEAAWNDLSDALSKKDDGMLETLIISGRALKVPNDTRVRPLQATMGRIKVRILEGPDVMKEGWVGERWLR
jgi:hypothetical protein